MQRPEGSTMRVSVTTTNGLDSQNVSTPYPLLTGALLVYLAWPTDFFVLDHGLGRFRKTLLWHTL